MAEQQFGDVLAPRHLFSCRERGLDVVKIEACRIVGHIGKRHVGIQKLKSLCLLKRGLEALGVKKLLAHCLHAVFEHTLDLVAVRRVGDEMVVAPCSKTRCGKEKRQKDFFHITIW